jgi:hypothetical protein
MYSALDDLFHFSGAELAQRRLDRSPTPELRMGPP